MNRRKYGIVGRHALGLAACVAAQAAFAGCGPEALGTSRTLTLPREGAAYGTAQYPALPLAPHEVAITFDDGPRAETTPDILKALREQCVLATFFMVGDALAHDIDLGRRVRAEGHSVAMHSYRHEHLAAMPESAQLADLQAMQQVFRNAFGAEAPAWRFPFLEETPALVAALKARGITLVSLDAGIDDWLPDQTPRILAERLVERLRKPGGGIVLLHDVQEQTARAMPLLLSTLKAHGYRVVHLEWAPERPSISPAAN